MLHGILVSENLFINDETKPVLFLIIAFTLRFNNRPIDHPIRAEATTAWNLSSSEVQWRAKLAMAKRWSEPVCSAWKDNYELTCR